MNVPIPTSSCTVLLLNYAIPHVIRLHNKNSRRVCGVIKEN